MYRFRGNLGLGFLLGLLNGPYIRLALGLLWSRCKNLVSARFMFIIRTCSRVIFRVDFRENFMVNVKSRLSYS